MALIGAIHEFGGIAVDPFVLITEKAFALHSALCGRVGRRLLDGEVAAGGVEGGAQVCLPGRLAALPVAEGEEEPGEHGYEERATQEPPERPRRGPTGEERAHAVFPLR